MKLCLLHTKKFNTRQCAIWTAQPRWLWKKRGVWSSHSSEMQHMFLIKVICGPGWNHMFGCLSFGRKQPFCCDVSDVVTTNGNYLACSVTVLHAGLLVLKPHLCSVFLGENNLYRQLHLDSGYLFGDDNISHWLHRVWVLSLFDVRR